MKRDRWVFTKGLLSLQWICCDIRYLDVSILGKFAVVMADPPWDIHMELPYGTLTDDEMRKLNIPILQDDGFLFLWVTGRSEEAAVCPSELWLSTVFHSFLLLVILQGHGAGQGVSQPVGVNICCRTSTTIVPLTENLSG